jgi:hypothetical protein
MSSVEKKVALALVVVLAVMVVAYVATGKSEAPAGGPHDHQVAAAAGGDAGCAPVPGGGGTAATQEYGEPGAKLDIIAVLPVMKGCHAQTEAELKKAYEAHPDDIHLRIVELMGAEAAKYQAEVKVNWTVVSINGRSSFELDGRQVVLQKQENGSYRPSDVAPIIEAELAQAG